MKSSKKYLLAVDIGNTTISFGILRGLRLLKVYSIRTTLPLNLLNRKLDLLLRIIKRKHPFVKEAIICSVVPRVSQIIYKAIGKHWNTKAVRIGRDVKVPIKNNYRYPKQVGQDRLVDAYAAVCLYKKPAIVIDFGTAITFNVISAQGEYEGGLIVPGIQLSADSLFHKTALLPRIETIKEPRTLIGKDTKESILSGIFFGYGAMCCGLIDLISKKIQGKPQVIVTGGYANLMKRFILKRITRVDRALVFKGMSLVYYIPRFKKSATFVSKKTRDNMIHR